MEIGRRKEEPLIFKKKKTLLKGEKLSFSWGKDWVFKDVSFSLASGESFFIQGPNGCGKTTFLKICSTLLLPSQGHLYFKQKRLNIFDTEFKKESLFIGHSLGLKNEATVQEFLDLFQIDLSSFLHFGEGIGRDKIVKELSYGQQKRLVLSRWVNALRHEPGSIVWIGDECFSGLDLKGQELLLVLIQKHLAQGGIFLASYHGSLPFKPTHHYFLENKTGERILS